jgi:hypothetical protein
MNKAQKIAWFNLAVLLSGAVLIVLFASMEAVKLMFAVLLFIAALLGVAPLFFRGKKGRVDFDERDQLIRMRALLFASISSFLYLIWQCAFQIIRVGPKGSIPVGTLVGTVCGALFFFVGMKSFWTLFEYRYGRKCNKKSDSQVSIRKQ